jgi:hypothetical protein
VTTHCDTLIIGAGLAGVTAARELISGGRDVIVIDKGRGVGGRMATRRLSGAAFDHGAQFISVRSDEFRGMVDAWIEAGVAALWSHGFADGLTGDGSLLTTPAGGTPGAASQPHTPARDGHPRYRGVPAMTAIPKHLAAGVDVRLGVRANAVRRLTDGTWEVDADAGRRYRSQAVIVTAPVPQALHLLESGETEIGGEQSRALRGIEYAPCLALMALSRVEISLPEPGVLRSPSESIEWISDNARKGVSAIGPAVTVHFSSAFSSRHYESADSDLLELMAHELGAIAPVELTVREVKRWRYSRPLRPFSVGAWTGGLPRGLVLAGDAFAGARVEGAALSGRAAARHLL